MDLSMYPTALRRHFHCRTESRRLRKEMDIYMDTNVSIEQIRTARNANLYDFLLKNHNCNFTREGDSLRLKDNHSISIRQGYCGYKDFATGETGNTIEFLTGHMGYTFVGAVQALAGGPAASHPAGNQKKGIHAVPPEFPAPADGNYKNLFAYLRNRGISTETLVMLIDQKAIYQEKKKNNIVFINGERDFAELRGTYTFGKPFHGVAANSRHDGFWWFRSSPNARTGYICESAVDAISLYELHKMEGYTAPAYYISIAGAAKQPAIDRLKHSKLDLVLAVDNDPAGQKCRNRNPELGYILPIRKDWNEDLQTARKHKQ